MGFVGHRLNRAAPAASSDLACDQRRSRSSADIDLRRCASAGALHGGEAGAELGVGAAERGLGHRLEMAREVHGGEEQVAELGFDLVGVGAGDLGVELGGFFGELVEEAVALGQSKPTFAAREPSLVASSVAGMERGMSSSNEAARAWTSSLRP
jgi:hypothetical protein